MSMLLKHALIRLATLRTRPLDALLLLFCGVSTVMLWPDLTDPSGAGWTSHRVLEAQGPVFAAIMAGIYLAGIPALSLNAIRGNAAGFSRGSAWAVQPHPALPLGALGRVLAESLAALAVLLAIRTALLVSGLLPDWLLEGLDATPADLPAFLGSLASGGLGFLLMLVVAASASQSIESYWLRLSVAVTGLFGAMQLGWLETLPGSVLTSSTLLAIALFLIARPIELRRVVPRRLSSGRALARGSLARPATDPESLFRRDLWTRPLPVAGLLLGIQAVMVALDRWLTLPRLALYFACVLTISWLVAFVTLQPLRSKLAVAGTFGKPGFQPGDFRAACSSLPLRPHVVSRSVFIFGLVTAAIIYLDAVGLIMLSAWFETGRLALVDSDGDSVAQLAFAMVAVVPILAGLLTYATHGNKRAAYVCGALFLLLPPVALPMIIKRVSNTWLTALILAVALIALAPTVKYLRQRAPRSHP